MKKINILFLPVCLLAMGFTGCKDDEAAAALPETVPLAVEASGKSFVMGETLTLTVKVNDEKNPDLVTNEDFDIYLTAKDGEADVSKTAFKDFPEMVTFPKGEKSFQIQLPVTESGIKPKQKLYVNVSAFVRGYTVTNPSQSIVISDLHYTVISLKNNSDNLIDEGDEFTLSAQVPVVLPADMVINITVPAEQQGLYETLPTALTIKAGETTGEVKVKTKHNPDPTRTETLVLNFATASAVHPLDSDEITITMNDLEAEKGEKLKDERWVYERPGIPFASSGKQATVNATYGDAVLINELDPHPNANLAAAGWKFYNAWEFHCIGNSGDTWKYENGTPNKVPLCLAARATGTSQTYAAVINSQFANIVEDGYLKMIYMKIPSTPVAPASGSREYGTAAFYACGTNNAYKASSQLILEGCRMEIRARLRGERKGFNMAIWLISNEAASQTTYSEVDILENPVGPVTGDKAFQTFHGGLSSATDKKSASVNNSVEMSKWNIYWMEWRSESEIALGINGEETICLKKSDWTDEEWTFTNAKNALGLKFILTMGAPSKWALGGGTTSGSTWQPDVNWDLGFASYNNYDRDRDNDAIPRLEIDWVRTYINKATIADYEGGKPRNTTKFY